MCTCTDIAEQIPESIPRMSLHEESIFQAMQYKWYRSEEHGRDLGTVALCGWMSNHWNGFLRACWLEHLMGVRFWFELRQRDFGILERRFKDSIYLTSIVDQLKERCENLDIILWMIDRNLPSDPIIEILEALDVNSARLKCEVLYRLRLAENPNQSPCDC